MQRGLHDHRRGNLHNLAPKGSVRKIRVRVGTQATVPTPPSSSLPPHVQSGRAILTAHSSGAHCVRIAPGVGASAGDCAPIKVRSFNRAGLAFPWPDRNDTSSQHANSNIPPVRSAKVSWIPTRNIHVLTRR